MCQVTEILEECLHELTRKSMPSILIISDEDFVGPLLGKGLKKRRTNKPPRRLEKFNLNIPLWYKDAKEDTIPFQFSKTIMEPISMSTTSSKDASNAEVKETVAETPEQILAKAQLEHVLADQTKQEMVKEIRMSKSLMFVLGAMTITVVGGLLKSYQESKKSSILTDSSNE